MHQRDQNRRYSLRSSQFGPSDQTNPYGAGGMNPPPKKSKTWLWILLGVGGVLVLACCGCFGAIGFGGKGMLDAGMGMVAQQIRPSLDADPVVIEHFGEIKEMNWNLMATGEANQGGKQDVLVWDVKGTKGEGQILGSLDQTTNPPKMRNGKIKMKSGEEFNLSQ